ncbi:MAG: coenzyme F420-0:L-glutamate ligase [Candidatus Bathycorpusculaceae bacterium]
MAKYKAWAIATKYWKPGENYLEEIVKDVKAKVVEEDFIVISEKALSTALNNIVDESTVKPSFSAKIISELWMQIVWGRFLGRLCQLRETTLQRLREYPTMLGSRHKQLALQYAGFLQTLMFGSEGGIDGSNLPYSYVSLPLKNADEIAEIIRHQIWLKLKKKIRVMIVDTDKTYSFRNFHFTPRPKPMKGIVSAGGIISYLFGRMFKLKRRATPLAVAGCEISVEEALEIAEIANRLRGPGAGRTVWDMSEKFKVALTAVSWEMLAEVKHKPIVIVRRIERKKLQ